MSKAQKIRHLVIAVGYNGQNYSGSQYQQNTKTIEGELGRVLQELEGMRDNEGAPSFSKASRTDSGVSAVIALFGYFGTEIDNLVDKMNEKLPSDIHVYDVQRQTPRFSPRKMCTGRQYIYYFPVKLLFCEDENILKVFNERFEAYKLFLEENKEDICKFMAKPEQFLMSDLAFGPEKQVELSKASLQQQMEAFDNFYLEKINKLVNNAYVSRPGNYTYLSSMKDQSFSVANRKHQEFSFSKSFVKDNRVYSEIIISGQAFLYNQIRKMIGAACLIAKGQAPVAWLARALSGRSEFATDVPMVPGEYLLLCKQIYKGYTGSEEFRLYGPLVTEREKTLEKAEIFKNDKILPGIFKTDEKVDQEFIKYINEQAEKVDMYQLAKEAILREIEVGKIIQKNKVVAKIQQ